jgi:hypothetical protein
MQGPLGTVGRTGQNTYGFFLFYLFNCPLSSHHSLLPDLHTVGRQWPGYDPTSRYLDDSMIR